MDTTADRLAVRERIEAYASAVFRKDAERWAACWAEDGVWNTGRGEIVGRDAIVSTWTTVMKSLHVVAFPTSFGEITIDGDTAVARSYVMEDIFAEDGTSRHNVGVYDDTLVRRDGRWLFKSRIYSVPHRYNRVAAG